MKKTKIYYDVDSPLPVPLSKSTAEQPFAAPTTPTTPTTPKTKTISKGKAWNGRLRGNIKKSGKRKSPNGRTRNSQPRTSARVHTLNKKYRLMAIPTLCQVDSRIRRMKLW
jgi:hypothetical protein